MTQLYFSQVVCIELTAKPLDTYEKTVQLNSTPVHCGQINCTFSLLKGILFTTISTCTKNSRNVNEVFAVFLLVSFLFTIWKRLVLVGQELSLRKEEDGGDGPFDLSLGICSTLSCLATATRKKWVEYLLTSQ